MENGLVTAYTETRIEGRTALQVSRSIRRSPTETEAILAELERDGIARETDGHWRLTDDAEARFGRCFRELTI